MWLVELADRVRDTAGDAAGRPPQWRRLCRRLEETPEGAEAQAQADPVLHELSPADSALGDEPDQAFDLRTTPFRHLSTLPVRVVEVDVADASGCRTYP